MHAYVIHMAASPAASPYNGAFPRAHSAAAERRRHIASQLRAVGVPYHYVAAIDGTDLTLDQRSEVDAHFLSAKPWLVGCALSHRKAYRAVLASGADYALIIEDDAVLPSSLPAVLHALHRVDLTLQDVVLLYWRASQCVAFKEEGAISLADRWGIYTAASAVPLYSAVAYVVGRGFCEAMETCCTQTNCAADSWATFLDAGAVGKLYCVVPRLCGVRTDMKSVIGQQKGTAVRPYRHALRSVTLGRLAMYVTHARTPLLYPLLRARRNKIEGRAAWHQIVSTHTNAPPPA